MLLTGCATVTGLKPEQIKAVRSIALAIEPYRTSPEILDHTQVMDKTYTGYQYGAIGGAIESIIKTIEANIVIKDSLKGSPAEFLKAMEGFQIQEDLVLKTGQALETGYKVIILQPSQVCAKDHCSVKQYVNAAKTEQADALVYFKYAYGVAAYANEKSGVAIDADIGVYQISNSKKLLQKVLSSDEAFRKGHTIDEFFAGDQALFKEEIGKAVEHFSKLIASMWGLYTDHVRELSVESAKQANFFDRNNIPYESISLFKMSCQSPVKLTKGCSGLWGAVQGVKINKYKTKIAASENGHDVLVMWGRGMGLTEDIKKIADENQIKILSAKVIGNPKTGGDGYILYTDGDLYTALSKYFY
jgi:hypothetical protein